MELKYQLQLMTQAQKRVFLMILNILLFYQQMRNVRRWIETIPARWLLWQVKSWH